MLKAWHPVGPGAFSFNQRIVLAHKTFQHQNVFMIIKVINFSNYENKVEEIFQKPEWNSKMQIDPTDNIIEGGLTEHEGTQIKTLSEQRIGPLYPRHTRRTRWLKPEIHGLERMIISSSTRKKVKKSFDRVEWGNWSNFLVQLHLTRQ